MTFLIRFSSAVCILAVCLFTVGCSSGTYVRHLASDACLVTPQQSTRKDIMNYMGEPDNRLVEAGVEKWIYYQRHKSFLRKAPYVGSKMGYEDYEALIITFNGDLVKTCVYKTYDEKEFKDSNIQNTTASESVDKK